MTYYDYTLCGQRLLSRGTTKVRWSISGGLASPPGVAELELDWRKATPTQPHRMCTSEFPVLSVDPTRAYGTEPLGTKAKFWVHHEQVGVGLVKYPREGSGEDWAEKVAAELAKLLGLPCAECELADVAGKRATISKRFLRSNAALIHGNELLLHIVPGYGPARSKYRVSKHTLDAVFQVFEVVGLDRVRVPIGWQPVQSVSNAADVFVGYLLLDAWISNTDRHHENWGLIGVPATETEPLAIHLAPTYDHATSLGCHEHDERRGRYLSGRDPRVTIESYCEKARSAFYLHPEDRKPLSTLEAFKNAAARYPRAAMAWLDILAGVSDSDADTIVGRIPASRISTTAAAFAQKLLSENRRRLLGNRIELS